MSLVDYASSSDEDEPETLIDKDINKKGKENLLEDREAIGVPVAGPSSTATQKNDTTGAKNRTSIPSSRKQMERVSNHPEPSELKLPDASFLLNSPAISSNDLYASDHSSRVAAAKAERKRELNVSNANYPKRKVPKGTLPHPKNVPDTVGGMLLPPQLVGRSNVVTEDISKLFVRRQASSSTE